MKRLLLLLVAAGTVGVVWRRLRGGSEEPSTWPQDAAGPGGPETDTEIDQPPLGGEVSEELLAILACPDDKQPVQRQGSFLVCETCQRHYPIRDGIPVMLLEEALTPDQAAALTGGSAGASAEDSAGKGDAGR